MAKYFMTVKKVDSDMTWEEELTSMVVTEDSPHEATYELGYHDGILTDLSFEQAVHYAENLIDWFNAGCRPNEAKRQLVNLRIEEDKNEQQ